MTTELSQYHAYLLRLWRADNGGQPAWRFSLESPQNERHTFTSFEDLVAFLRREIESGGRDGGSASSPGEE